MPRPRSQPGSTRCPRSWTTRWRPGSSSGSAPRLTSGRWKPATWPSSTEKGPAVLGVVVGERAAEADASPLPHDGREDDPAYGVVHRAVHLQQSHLDEDLVQVPPYLVLGVAGHAHQLVERRRL